MSTLPLYLTLKNTYCDKFRRQAIETFGSKSYIADLSREIHRNQDISISKDTITRILNGNRGRSQNVVSICEHFSIYWEEACITPDTYLNEDISSLVKKARATVTFGFESGNYGVSHHQPSQWIQDNFIELDLVEVEFLPSEYPVNDPSSLIVDQKAREDEFDRIGIRLLRGTRKTSRQVLEDPRNIFVYGEPGAGKTSYLQWISLKCRDGVFLEDYVPVFIAIRQLATESRANSLLTFIENMFERWGISSNETRTILESGKAMFIFDGLDETPSSERNFIEIMIERLLRDYDQCYFIFSSRLAINFSFVSGFQKVIISPLQSRKHIPEFVKRWFAQVGKQPEMANLMLEKLQSQQYQGIRELARRPVLLKLLCIVFEFEGDFPTKRVDVFRSGISKMTRSQNDIETHIPKIPKLHENHIHEILCRIASYFFIDFNVQMLFGVRDVERVIQDYFKERYGINRDEVLASNILSGIERSNGLLVRWAQNFCAFSHLTYQEFFTAEYLVNTNRYTDVYQHISDPRWHFVTGLVTEFLRKEFSSAFFDGFKQSVDELINKDDKLNAFLDNLSRAATYSTYSIVSTKAHIQTYVRAWYFAYALQDNGKITNLGNLSSQFDLPDLEFATSMITSQVLEGHELIYKAYHYLSHENSPGSFSGLIRQVRDFLSENARQKEVLDGWLDLLRREENEFSATNEWLAQKRTSWIKRVARLLENLGLPCIFGLTPEQLTKLRTYYDATKLLSTCINRSQLDAQKRQQLADSMLLVTTLPPSEDEFMGF